MLKDFLNSKHELYPLSEKIDWRYFNTNSHVIPSDFVHFRKRIGVGGLKKVLKYTVELNGLSKSSKKIVLSDTTVQENNITYPTDAKLLKKVVDRCNKIVKDENLPQRQVMLK